MKTKVLRTHPSIQIELPDGAIMEITDESLEIFEAGDVPGMADPLNSYELKSMYRVEILDDQL